MSASFQAFVAEHQAEHRSSMNRWSLIVGDALLSVSVIAALLGLRRRAALVGGAALAVAMGGHLIDGNLPRALHDTVRHPLWTVRGDIAVARATIFGGR
jgi:hypothetical protein